jgi:hypothetical protein
MYVLNSGEILTEELFNLIVGLCDLCEECWFHEPNEKLKDELFVRITRWVQNATGVELKVSTVIEVLCIAERLEVVDGRLELAWCEVEWDEEGEVELPFPPEPFVVSDVSLLWDFDEM